MLMTSMKNNEYDTFETLVKCMDVQRSRSYVI